MHRVKSADTWNDRWLQRGQRIKIKEPTGENWKLFPILPMFFNCHAAVKIAILSLHAYNAERNKLNCETINFREKTFSGRLRVNGEASVAEKCEPVEGFLRGRKEQETRKMFYKVEEFIIFNKGKFHLKTPCHSAGEIYSPSFLALIFMCFMYGLILFYFRDFLRSRKPRAHWARVKFKRLTSKVKCFPLSLSAIRKTHLLSACRLMGVYIRFSRINQI